ncbi:unnamed protein product [Ectocarpus sp. CCAP 1310/34]|nr:unnamed protein product [Ectocarpus sp. CCAP 1310/34]
MASRANHKIGGRRQERARQGPGPSATAVSPLGAGGQEATATAQSRRNDQPRITTGQQEEQPPQRKKRNRPKKKRGKGGGGGGGAAVIVEGALAAPTESRVDATKKQIQRQQKTQPPKPQLQQQEGEQYQHRNGEQQLPQHQGCLPNDEQAQLQQQAIPPADHGVGRTVATVPATANCYTHDVPSRLEEKSIVAHAGAVTAETRNTAAKKIPQEDVAAVDRKDTAIDKDMKAKGSTAGGIAPFESSWTTAPGRVDIPHDPITPTLSKGPGRSNTDDISLAAAEECSGSERSFQDFQDGDHSEPNPQPGEPDPVTGPSDIRSESPTKLSENTQQTIRATAAVQPPVVNSGGGCQEGELQNSASAPGGLLTGVGGSLGAAEDSKGDLDGHRTVADDGMVMDPSLEALSTEAPEVAKRGAAEGRQPVTDVVGEKQGDEGNSVEHGDGSTMVAGQEDDETLPNVMPRQHVTGQGQRLCQGAKGKGPGGHGSTEDEEPGALKSNAALPVLPTEQRRVRFAIEEPNDALRIGERDPGSVHSEEEEGEVVDEVGEDTLLLPEGVPAADPTTDQTVSQQNQRDTRGDDQRKKTTEAENEVTKTQKQQQPQCTLEKDLMVNKSAADLGTDDVDDESSALLDPSPIAATRTVPCASRSNANVPANTKADRAAEDECLSSASSRAGPAAAGVGSTSSDVVATPAAPLSKPAPSALPGTTPAAFNYYELPPIPEEANERVDRQQQKQQQQSATLGGIWAAVRRGDATGVRAKLAAGATIDEADSEGRTPLMVACASGDTEMASLLVNGVSPPSSVAARTIEGWTPLMIASGGGRLGVVKVLLQAGAALHDRDDEFGSNSFMWACGGGHAEVVRVMLANGAKDLIHSTNSDMWTPLMVACDAGSLATVQVLVEAGADLASFNNENLTALDIAADRNHLLVECYLRTEGAVTSDQFWSAADSGDAATISKLLRGNGHLVMSLDKNGRTALLRSCIGGHLEVARLLVEAGADGIAPLGDGGVPNFTTDKGDTSSVKPRNSHPLPDVLLAFVMERRYLVQIGGARLTLKNKVGWTPLMQAVVKGDLEITR